MLSHNLDSFMEWYFVPFACSYCSTRNLKLIIQKVIEVKVPVVHCCSFMEVKVLVQELTKESNEPWSMLSWALLRIWWGTWCPKIQPMEGIEPAFVAQGVIAHDEFCGSMLDLLQAYHVFKHFGSPELGTVTQLGPDQRQVEMQDQRRGWRWKYPTNELERTRCLGSDEFDVLRPRRIWSSVTSRSLCLVTDSSCWLSTWCSRHSWLITGRNMHMQQRQSSSLANVWEYGSESWMLSKNVTN